jgi:two-component system, NarL family, invasion response regulator UvrY
MNGIDATRLIRSFSDSIRVVGLSMHSDYPYVKALMQAGANGYVTKSAGKEEIFRAIYDTLEGKEYFCADINMLRL